jgi:hypothetical protein
VIGIDIIYSEPLEGPTRITRTIRDSDRLLAESIAQTGASCCRHGTMLPGNVRSGEVIEWLRPAGDVRRWRGGHRTRSRRPRR